MRVTLFFLDYFTTHLTFPVFQSEAKNLFCYFWLDPKVTKRSRLRALHTSSRRLQAGKSGNSLRFRQPDFLSPCSLLRRLTARGRRTKLIVNG
ncbi:hypothetical protein FJN16_11715 [Tannerella forsythia]|nr:hypothetical protein FJN16_11715 [Tannerella forsythia]